MCTRHLVRSRAYLLFEILVVSIEHRPLRDVVGERGTWSLLHESFTVLWKRVHFLSVLLQGWHERHILELDCCMFARHVR
jgi:hypothetical protein